jgi:hypothetical protein
MRVVTGLLIANVERNIGLQCRFEIIPKKAVGRCERKGQLHYMFSLCRFHGKGFVIKNSHIRTDKRSLPIEVPSDRTGFDLTVLVAYYSREGEDQKD